MQTNNGGTDWLMPVLKHERTSPSWQILFLQQTSGPWHDPFRFNLSDLSEVYSFTLNPQRAIINTMDEAVRTSDADCTIILIKEAAFCRSDVQWTQSTLGVCVFFSNPISLWRPLWKTVPWTQAALQSESWKHVPRFHSIKKKKNSAILFTSFERKWQIW